MIKSKIEGLPGTGKTTKLISTIDGLLKDGTIQDLSETCICTFRKEMASDMTTKLKSKYAIESWELRNIGTIHGVCKRLLNIPKNSVVENKDIMEFMSKRGLEYSQYDADIIEPSDTGKHKKGNILMDAYKWAKETNIDNNDLSEYPNLHRVNDVIEIESFISDYDSFKQEKGISDFTDMLCGVVDNELIPDTNVLIVDEFQDLSPIQFKIFNQWAATASYIYIAGDVYQSIYPFWGATPEFFNGYNAELEILPTSRRFGKTIWNFSRGILEDAGYNNIPNIEAVGNSNEVKQIDVYDYYSLIPNFTSNTFHLIRCNYMAYPIANVLINAGVLFKGNYGWNDNQLVMLNSLILLRNTGYLNVKGLVELINIHSDEYFSKPKNTLIDEIVKAHKVEYQLSELKQFLAPLTIHCNENFINSITKMPYLEYSDMTDFNKLKFGAALERLKEPQYNVSVNVGTIHSAKGREAQNVFVWNETNRRIDISCSDEEKKKDEARVWFVATTRAMNNLYWVNSGKCNSWGV